MKAEKTVFKLFSVMLLGLFLSTLYLLPEAAASVETEDTAQQGAESRQASEKQAAENQKPAQKPSNAEDELPVIKSGTNLVTLNLTVTDPYGRYVTGLTKDQFEVYDDKVPQKIEFFSSEDAPISIGVIFDVSGSMKGRMDRSYAAMRRFFEVGHDRDEYFLVTFNNGAKLTQDFTTDSKMITNSLFMVEPKGQTALYDAAYIGIEKVRRGRYSRKAILLISDGQDNNSRYTFKELKQLVKEADVQIYAIGITNVFGARELDVDGQVLLEEMTRLTGGRAFFPSNDAELTEVITRIGLELRHQYSISYEPTGIAQDGKWHKLKVKLNAPKGMPSLTVRTREGYFAKQKAVN